jgi:hypothetical protein
MSIGLGHPKFECGMFIRVPGIRSSRNIISFHVVEVASSLMVFLEFTIPPPLRMWERSYQVRYATWGVSQLRSSTLRSFHFLVIQRFPACQGRA